MRRSFKKEFESLDAIFGFIAEFFDTRRIDPDLIYTVNLAVEELFTNMVKYNPESRQDVAISLRKSGSRLIASLTDFDVEPFDVTRVKEVEIPRSIDQCKPGGLGLHLVKSMVDQLRYRYVDRNSTVTFIVDLAKQDRPQ